MLSAPDLALVRRESRLPGLALALDEQALAAVLAERWPQARVGRLVLTYVRLKPGTSCLVAGTIDVAGQPWPVHVNVLPIGSSKVAHPRARVPASGPDGLVPLAIDALGLAVWPFPNDAALRPLARLHQPAERTRVLSAISALDPSAEAGRLQTLAYKPERRYVAAWAPPGRPVATLRLHVAASARAVAAARQLRSRGDLRLPSLIGASPRWQAMLVEWLPGVGLPELISDPQADPAPLGRRVGAALAELHASGPADLPAHGVGDAVRTADAAAAHVSWTSPDLSPRAAALARELRGVLAAGDRRHRCTIHGDFYAKQVLIDQSHVAFVDMDEAAAGDPAMDVANFLAHLELEVVMGRLWEARAREVAEAFLEGYRWATSSAGGASFAGLDAQVAAALIRLAPRPFRERLPVWSVQTEALIARAEAHIRIAHRRVRRASGADRLAAPPLDPRVRALAADPALAFVLPAIDCVKAAEWLNDVTTSERAPVVGVQQSTVLRHKPGRRCLIEFQVRTREGPERWLAKVRAKGADTRTARLQDALWRSGFDDSSAHGVSVPEVIGVAPHLRLWLQRQVEGAVGLGDDRWLEDREVWSRAARAAVRLHASSIAPDRTHTIADELTALDSRLESLAARVPTLAADVARLRTACAVVAECCPAPAVPRCLHRDFYFDQVLVVGKRLYLVDLDTAAMGDPALDAGNFIAHLLERAVREPGQAGSALRAARAFRASFLAASLDVDPRSVEAYTTLALARLAAITCDFAERRPFTGAVVRACLERCEAASRFSVVGAVAPR